MVHPFLLHPTRLTVAHGFVAAGRQNSQLDARRLGGGEVVYKGHCGGSVNNALHIGRDSSQQVGMLMGRCACVVTPASSWVGHIGRDASQQVGSDFGNFFAGAELFAGG